MSQDKSNRPGSPRRGRLRRTDTTFVETRTENPARSPARTASVRSRSRARRRTSDQRSHSLPPRGTNTVVESLEPTRLHTTLGHLQLLDKEHATLAIGPPADDVPHLSTAKKPESGALNILHTQRDLRKSLDRTQCIVLLRSLSKKPVKMDLTLSKTAVAVGPAGNKASWEGQAVDAATVLILAIGLRGSADIAAELIGLAQPVTVRNLVAYVHPAWIRWDSGTVVELIHSTARNVGQARGGNGSQAGSLLLLRYVPLVTAKLLTTMSLPEVRAPASDLDEGNAKKRRRQKRKREDKKKAAVVDAAVKIETISFMDVFDDIFKRHEGDRAEAAGEKRDPDADEARDRGIEVGLLLAGVRHWLRDLSARDDVNFGRAKLTLQVIFGGLSGVPLGGPAFSATQPLLETFVNAKQDGREKIRGDIWDKIWDVFVVGIEDERLPRVTERDLQLLESYWRWKKAVLDAETPRL